MKIKTIKKILEAKHLELCESIKDDNTRKLVRENAIITGGCIVSMLLQEKVKDFDFYFTSKETVLAVAKYYVDKFSKENGSDCRIKVFEDRVSIYIPCFRIIYIAHRSQSRIFPPPDFLTNATLYVFRKIITVIL